MWHVITLYFQINFFLSLFALFGQHKHTVHDGQTLKVSMDCIGCVYDHACVAKWDRFYPITAIFSPLCLSEADWGGFFFMRNLLINFVRILNNTSYTWFISWLNERENLSSFIRWFTLIYTECIINDIFIQLPVDEKDTFVSISIIQFTSIWACGAVQSKIFLSFFFFFHWLGNH